MAKLIILGQGINENVSVHNVTRTGELGGWCDKFQIGQHAVMCEIDIKELSNSVEVFDSFIKDEQFSGLVFLTKCHFPTIPDEYPTSFRASAIVVSL